ncbi:MAG: type I-E CRISPR-associated protein Cse2/CasB [Syntrophales bacterium]|nr:type I-E CRISPR-associated protein Cse2/CasB [Syntrophales bacterium]
MSVEEKKKKREFDYVELYRRFLKLDPGLKAMLRRASKPEDLRDTIILYRLFYESKPNPGHLRVLFLMPWCEQFEAVSKERTFPLGAHLKRAGINERRIFQMVRASTPHDLVHLRHMVMQVKPKPKMDWANLGKKLFFWTDEDKREILEDYFYVYVTTEKE